MLRGQKNISSTARTPQTEDQKPKLLDLVTTELRIKISLYTKTNVLILCKPYF
ncbi:hypothetical protein [Stygiobacter electus]|uniref:Uncharacterized protein n=1 Tax=Stygiobacter electus TaxID=3032292 RepID=A0AAE3NZ24_9BACT|nr:hypothetical protein [Stygiobacter electus]MDF1612681.1 hypothetical protein [Stygiobacter electus]